MTQLNLTSRDEAIQLIMEEGFEGLPQAISLLFNLAMEAERQSDGWHGDIFQLCSGDLNLAIGGD